MINISVVRDKQGFIWKFEIKGHAGYAKKGQDIVCSAVSVLAYTAVGALGDMAGVNEFHQEDGYMVCSIPRNISEQKKVLIKTILETIVIGFKQIELSYKRYVSVLDEEV